MNNVTIFDHPLIQHKISILRSVETSSNQFRALVEEITMLMCFESMRDLPLEDVEVTTPIAKTTTKMLAGVKLAIVPILRAGLGMVNGMLNLVPSARVGHIGMYRDEVTLEPHEYYCKLPKNIDKRLVIVCDPMLATGGSAKDAINLIKERGGKHIKFMCLIAAPEGIKALTEAHPDVEVYCAHVDERLNENGYIVPGLGDAGDRIFGTK
ncbi:MAG: uracil phosphoribosyltransferase [Clostridia bacterium]|nr:uracil phosphoribosyltransferase [Clostridia bacterium]MBR3991883.1 uracil phosphoribosyltransferase [Clostridia bacterium]